MSLSEIFTGMKVTPDLGPDKITISGLITSLVLPAISNIGIIVVTATTTSYAPLSNYQVLDFLHSTRSLELPVLAVHESLCTAASGV